MYYILAKLNHPIRFVGTFLAELASYSVPEKPSSPRKLKVSDVTKDSACLSWDSPKSDGGSPVTRYVVEKRQDSSGEFVEALSVDGSTCSVKVDGLSPDCSYEFRVFAQNEAGSSESPAEMKTPVTTVKAIGNVSFHFVYSLNIRVKAYYL